MYEVLRIVETMWCRGFILLCGSFINITILLLNYGK